jgi:hypothetical protein
MRRSARKRERGRSRKERWNGLDSPKFEALNSQQCQKSARNCSSPATQLAWGQRERREGSAGLKKERIAGRLRLRRVGVVGIWAREAVQRKEMILTCGVCLSA